MSPVIELATVTDGGDHGRSNFGPNTLDPGDSLCRLTCAECAINPPIKPRDALIEIAEVIDRFSHSRLYSSFKLSQ
jgi:hypothetical protein